MSSKLFYLFFFLLTTYVCLQILSQILSFCSDLHLLTWISLLVNPLASQYSFIILYFNLCLKPSGNDFSVQKEGCYRLMVCVSLLPAPDSYVETLTCDVTIFGDVACEEVIKVKGSNG